MKTKLLVFAALAASLAGATDTKVALDWSAPRNKVAPGMWGIFFEDINWAADGGLSPELLANGGFNWQPRDHEKWTKTQEGWEGDFRDGGMARLSFQMGKPVHPNTARHLRIESFGKGLAGVKNTGLDGFKLVKGETYRIIYDFRELTEKKDGIDWVLPNWTRVITEFVFNGEPILFAEDGMRVEVTETSFSLLVRGRRIFEFDNVSLEPTGPNLVRAGLRKDLVDRLADLKPAFVRFPGGCIVEEGDFQHWYDWRRTVGPKERRECVWNRWGRDDKPYWETFRVGFYEYFVLCEEIGAEPLPICLAGLTCQFQRPPQLVAVEDADYFANVILELIEFANGDVTTTWGKVRADMGHPKPFNMKMVGIGNENWDAEFFDRAEPIARIVRKKHPEIMIVGSSGPAPEDKRWKYAWGRVTKETADIVDEHYYMSPEWFLDNFRRYDNYDRKKLPVYAGEYACHHKIKDAKGHETKPNSLWSAVCEAVVMCGFERNADIVQMASYAPLFARWGHDQWTPDMIWFDTEKSWLTPNYYVQQLFFTNRPDYTVPCKVDNREKTVFESAGVDAKANEIVVKLVNVGESPRRVTVDFGKNLPNGEAKMVSLAGERLAVNTREAPETVAPKMSAIPFAGGKMLVVELPANSVNVVRVAM
ncbi:MAG: alpha-L-arabinofuranosidase [Kiritimatiellae bacterium]|nr:alpha-L-arabinofuranosidase [Kiritimatiellia bacterium]